MIFYPILILVVAIYAIVSGFRKGLTGQLASLLGLGFGAVAARVFTPVYADSFQWTSQVSQAPEFSDFSSNLVCGVVIYFVVFWLFSILSPFFNLAMRFIEVGILNRLVGAAFSLLVNLLWVSILFNLILCFSASSGLLRYERADDGNLVAAVMAITPAVIGCYGADDFAHFNQLKEAKSISCNFNMNYNVIFAEDSSLAFDQQLQLCRIC